ncbi:unnamed protein product [Cyprideis torosa]|uniref:Uncharacterized protein n=1 Tax=Cyprideis torosa TaxID=163714 RepID=A0A7R8W576_9CRUS|nr:unnamed protein product [Cyprideis torosa]CAG0880594.1 unnamed protein product [Cyprideis torosa]
MVTSVSQARSQGGQRGPAGACLPPPPLGRWPPHLKNFSSPDVLFDNSSGRGGEPALAPPPEESFFARCVMSELCVSAPLALSESDVDSSGFGEFQVHDSVDDANANTAPKTGLPTAPKTERSAVNSEAYKLAKTGEGEPVFTESLSSSLEDLVNTFDDKITKCFGNFSENAEDIAPVQIKSQEELLSSSKIWNTLTDNYGNVMSVDWSNSHIRDLYMPTLNLRTSPGNSVLSPVSPEDESLTSEDEAVASDLDLHGLIYPGLQDAEPIKGAEEVIKEIDLLMQGSPTGLDKADVASFASRPAIGLLYEDNSWTAAHPLSRPGPEDAESDNQGQPWGQSGLLSPKVRLEVLPLVCSHPSHPLD